MQLSLTYKNDTSAIMLYFIILTIMFKNVTSLQSSAPLTVSLRFHSDHSNHGNGFLLKWQTFDISSCDTWFVFSPNHSSSSTQEPLVREGVKDGTTIVDLFQHNGTITSPGYPNWLIPTFNCTIRLVAPQGFKILLTLIDVDLGSKECPVHRSARCFSPSSKFNKCFLKNSITSPSSSRFRSSSFPSNIHGGVSHFVPSTGDPENITDSERLSDVVEEALWNENEDEDITVKHHINLSLDPDSEDEKIITICGSIDRDEEPIGQVFLSYKSSIKMDLVTKSSKFRQIYAKRRGFKFNYEFVPEHVNSPNSDQFIPIVSVTHIKTESIGHITSLNFPHPIPLGVRHKTVLQGEFGSNLELRVPKSMIHLFRNGTCDKKGELTTLAVKDYFGDISLYPPIPNIWSICLNNYSGNLKTENIRSWQSIQRQHHAVYRTKSIQSNFHVISIESTSLIQAPFLFYYKSYKDKDFSMKAMPLPSRYLQESCDGNPCSVHGECKTKVYKNSTLHYCKCNRHWTGLFCHMTLCERNPCGGRGVCKLDSNENTFNCHCNPGFTGKTCRDTLEKCDWNNPCRDRGRCSMINGEPNCSCQPWFEGKFCERFRYKGQYKPLSQRMLEEPFWLGLIAIGSVIILISFAYCLKKMFAEQIEQFFTEEIEKAKYMPYNFTEVGSGPRYSVTSNIGLNVNVNTPGSRNGALSGDGGSPLPRSRSSIIGKLRKKGFKSRRSGGGHVSDSEVFRSHESRLQELDSDAESIPTPASRRFPSFFLGKRGSSGCSINNGNTSSSHRDSYIEMKPNPDALDTNKILAGLVQPAPSSNRDRRMSLDDFMKATEAKIRKRKLLEIEGYNIHEYEKRSPGSLISETSFITGQGMNDSTPGDRCIPTISEFHVITENSMEEVESNVSNGSRSPSNPKLMIEHWTSDRENSLSDKLPVLKQESEIEGILTNIRSIQRAAAIDASTTSHSEDSDHREKGIILRPASPRPRLSRPPSGFSSSSSDSKDAQVVVPSITVTEVCMEYEPSMYPEDVDEEEEEEAQDEYHEVEGRQILSVRMFDRESSACSHHKKSFDMNMRRASVPNPGMKGGAGDVTRESRKVDLASTRKYSLDVEKPKITITADYDAQIHQSTKCSRRRISTGQCSDRTVSESNISTSGYSSFSSPGISRCSSSSPITDFTSSSLQNVQVPKMTLSNDKVTVGGPQSPVPVGKQSKHKSTFGNFLTIPNVSYSLVPHQHQSSNSPPFKGKEGTDSTNFVFPSGSPSRRASQESRDEGIDVSSLASTSSSKFANSPTSSVRRDRFSHATYSLESTAEESCSINVRRSKVIHNSRSFDCFPYQLPSQCDTMVTRQPSWPGLLLPPPEGSPSSDSDADTIREQEHERKLMLLKRQERRSRSDSNQSLNKSDKGHQSRRELFKSRSRSPLTRFSKSTDAAYQDESSYRFCEQSSTKNSRPGFVRCNSARSLIMSRSLHLDDESSSQSSESLLSSPDDDDQNSNVTTIRAARSLNTIMFQSPSRTSTATTTSGSGRDSENLFHPLSGMVIKKSPSERILIQMRETSQSLPNEASAHQCYFDDEECTRKSSPSCPHHHHHENPYHQLHASDMVVNRNTTDFSSSQKLHKQSTSHPLRRDLSMGSVKQSLPKGIKRLLKKGKSVESSATVRSLSVSPSFNTSCAREEEISHSFSSDERRLTSSLSPSPTQSRSRTSLIRQKASVDIPP